MQSMQAKAILFTGVDQVSLEQVEIPPPAEGEILLEALYTLISPGTELRCRAGKQEGTVFPFIPGYSFAGRVIGAGAGTTLKEGTLVYCGGTIKSNVNHAWGGHISHAVRSEQDVYPLPEGMDLVWGAATRLAAIAYRGVRLSQPKAHETVAVIGLGAIYALGAWILIGRLASASPNVVPREPRAWRITTSVSERLTSLPLGRAPLDSVTRTSGEVNDEGAVCAEAVSAVNVRFRLSLPLNCGARYVSTPRFRNWGAHCV